MFKLWTDLFKTADGSPSAEVKVTEIHEDWLAIEEDFQTAEAVQNIHEHQILTKDMKRRRAQWAKRIQKGRKASESGKPTMALRKRNARNSTSSQKTEVRAEKITEKSPLQNKLRMAIEANK